MAISKNYRDIMIVDELGRIVYFTIDNLNFFELKPEELLGSKITMLYENLTDESSHMMYAIKTGNSTVDYCEELQTQTGKIVRQIASVYPLFNGDRTVGSIEFASYDEQFDTLKPGDHHASDSDMQDTQFTLDDMIGEHKSMLLLKSKIKKIAPIESPVLICGKTGTGKEMVAQSIHNCSNRKNGPFISLNCSALPENLLESLLFGTAKGSFTGAEDRKGIFEISNGGTLFLDEINSLPFGLQAKVLTAIEEKSIRRIGGSETIHLEVRIMAACNMNADLLLQEKQLRDDLYFRLSVIQLNLPDLKDRGNDIAILANHFVAMYNKKFHRSIARLSTEVIALLMKHAWPGNVRELKNTIEGLFISVLEEKIQVKDLPEFVNSEHPIDLKAVEIIGLSAFMQNEEKRILSDAYKSAGWNYNKAAGALNISVQLMKYKIEKFDLMQNRNDA
jgi:arginine utilization regulatory protein